MIASYGFSQELTASDLTKLKEMNLNDSETLLSNKKFDFKEVRESDDNEKYYAFAFNLDKYGDKGDEYIVISIDENENSVFYVYYQLEKEGWTKLKNSLSKLGYKKTKTESESDGSITTKYSNSKFDFSFNVGKTQNDENESVFIYTLSVM